MMLRLKDSTRENWISQALDDLPSILLDHAHCEKKAASTAISFLFRYPEYAHLMKPLSELAREELRHFEQVLEIMKNREINFVRQVPSEYAGKLVSICRRNEPQRMLDLLICSSLIEARSCERMKILSTALRDRDASLAQFYKGLLACEARHHQIYLDMAASVFTRDEIENRLQEIVEHESAVLFEEGKFIRLHS
jgi:tRNA 2-(methylsulfanyl)-N6-isopentenyladenosine37 hydroxylase